MTTLFRSQSAKLRIPRHEGKDVKIEFAHMRKIVRADSDKYARAWSVCIDILKLRRCARGPYYLTKWAVIKA
jgi:hypothetical protein